MKSDPYWLVRGSTPLQDGVIVSFLTVKAGGTICYHDVDFRLPAMRGAWHAARLFGSKPESSALPAQFARYNDQGNPRGHCGFVGPTEEDMASLFRRMDAEGMRFVDYTDLKAACYDLSSRDRKGSGAEQLTEVDLLLHLRKISRRHA